MKLVEELQNIGKAHNATAGQVALAWLLAQGEDIIPIPGTKKIKVRAKVELHVVHLDWNMHEHSISRRTWRLLTLNFPRRQSRKFGQLLRRLYGLVIGTTPSCCLWRLVTRRRITKFELRTKIWEAMSALYNYVVSQHFWWKWIVSSARICGQGGKHLQTTNKAVHK